MTRHAAVAFTFIAMSVCAASAEAFPWLNPGADRYIGTERDAMISLGNHGAPFHQLEKLDWAMDDGECLERDIQQDEVIDLMMSGNGKVMHDVVARVDRWKPGISRRVLDCGDAYGNHLLYPLACGNWAYQYWPRNTLGPPPEWLGPPESGEWIEGLPLPLWIGFPGGPFGATAESATAGQSGVTASVPEASGVMILGAALLGMFLAKTAAAPRTAPGPSGPESAISAVPGQAHTRR